MMVDVVVASAFVAAGVAAVNRLSSPPTRTGIDTPAPPPLDADLPCPWCRAPTREDDERCPSCRQRFG